MAKSVHRGDLSCSEIVEGNLCNMNCVCQSREGFLGLELTWWKDGVFI